MYHICLLIIFCFLSETLQQDYLANLTITYPGYGKSFIFFPGENGQFRKAYLELRNSRINLNPSEDIEKSVSFTYYSRNVPKGLVIDTRSKLKKVYEKSKATKIITHGWMSKGSADTCISIKDGYLKKYDVNVFILDWGNIADNIVYPIAAESTPKVGKYYAEFLNYLVDNLDANPKDLHLIGHSLGAHVSGFAARRVKRSKIGRVTGLDPALPGFKLPIKLAVGGRLGKGDAEFVDVIHTCMGILGLDSAIGHVDFYPNGGSPPQPGCASIIEMIDACSHGRSWQYFANSIVDDTPFLAYHCPSYEDFVYGQHCYGNPIPMGDRVPLEARGVYYLRTNLTLPFIS